MSELKHWLDETSDADEFERSILRAGLAVDPDPGKADEVWSGVLKAVSIAPVVVVAVSAAHGAGAKTALGGAGKAAVVWLSVGKGFVVGLALYGAASGVTTLVERGKAEPAIGQSVAGRSSVAPRSAPRAASPASPVVGRAVDEPAPTPELAPSAVAAPTPKAPAASPSARQANAALPSVAAFAAPNPGKVEPESQLQAEARALRGARAELRSGKLADAFATLEASRRRFAAPELDQEREALMIELLFRSGQVTTARKRASDFLARFPESPHAAAIRELMKR